MKNKDIIYIVAGDRMMELMNNKYPKRIIIPFRENLSIGTYCGYSFDDKFIDERIKALNTSKKEYTEKLKPIMEIDISKEYILVFGEDDCCKANLNFMIKYLKEKGYNKKVEVQIVDEYSLNIIKKYQQ